MANDLAQLQATLFARMRELGTSPTDPRLTPLLSQLQGLMRQHLASAQADGRVVLLDRQAEAKASQGGAGAKARTEYSLAPAVAALVDAYLEVARPASYFVQAPALSASEEGRRILALPPSDRADVAVHAYAAWCGERHDIDAAALRRLVSDLLRSKLELGDARALALVKAAVREGFAYASYSPNQAVAHALQRHVESHGMSPELHDALTGLRARMIHSRAGDNAEGRRLSTAVDGMLARSAQPGHQGDPLFEPKPDAWGRALTARLSTLPPDMRARLHGLLALAAKGGDSAKPGKGWLKLAHACLASDDRQHIGLALLDIIELHEPGANLELRNQDTLRALIWLAAIATPAGAARRLEGYAQKCLTFSSAHFAYLSLVLGNATVHAFSLLPGTDGAASLARLKRRLKRPGEIKTIEKALAALAAARGMTAAELEEIGLPDFGFDAGARLEIPVGPAIATLAITETGALETSWRGVDGQALKTAPAALREHHADALKAFKAQTKEIDETLRAQRLRLEQLYFADRIWSAGVWRARYLEELLVAGLVRRLIWSFETGGRWVAALPHDGVLADASGTPLDIAQTTRVKLWHPMQSATDHVQAWRRRLAQLGVTQPFKQAHREIYVLTDAERETHIHSNRFAGHIVDQHRFRALAMARGWKCPAFGGWDPGDGRPLKRLPERDLQIEFQVDPIESTMDRASFQFQHLSTAHIRFTTSGGEPMPLEQIDPIIFSELLRDGDLFVGVASIGNDPAWADRGDDDFAGYWGEAASGALTETGKTRHAVLEDLLPGLAIAPCCRLEERYLVVDGRMRSYRIHLGSGNVQMEPDSQYLCIVPDRQSRGGHVRLPFEGDATLSIILSKAFMLAEDDKIEDRSIRTQIMRGVAGA